MLLNIQLLKQCHGVKWDRATAGKKPATLDNGLETMVALHLEAGSTVRINTVTGDIA